MWKIATATIYSDVDEGRLHLIQLDEDGNETPRELIFPCRVPNDFDVSLVDDRFVVRYLRELADYFDPSVGVEDTPGDNV